jgi:hypothetical protein
MTCWDWDRESVSTADEATQYSVVREREREREGVELTGDSTWELRQFCRRRQECLTHCKGHSQYGQWTVLRTIDVTWLRWVNGAGSTSDLSLSLFDLSTTRTTDGLRSNLTLVKARE